MSEFSIQFNKVLTDVDREKYQYIVDHFWNLCPGLMGRKYPRANVQQAFGYAMFQNFYLPGDRTLFVGCFEDTAYETCLAMGYPVEGIDPAINYSLESFVQTNPQKYDIILSISVIEHVQDDETFIRNICSLLNNGGIAILTMDYRNSPGIVPVEDYRLYTEEDYSRIEVILSSCGCELVDKPDLQGTPDFQYGNSIYSFSTLVFRKK